MKKCRHENGILSEWVDRIFTVLIEKGETLEKKQKQESVSEYVFSCFDCKKIFRFFSLGKKPKWLKNYIERNFQ